MKTTNDKRFPTQTLEKVSFFMRKSSAFTLIELLVVVLIIGVLAAIAVPQYQKAVWKARAAEMLVWAGNAKRVVETYILQNGGFPSNDEDLLQSGIAPIDLVKNLTCEGEGGNRICYNKHYGYRIHCASDRCTVIIEQMEDGNMATGTMEGALEMRGTSSWVAEAGYINGSLAGRVNCEAFANAFNGVCEGIDAGGGEEGGGGTSGSSSSLAASVTSIQDAMINFGLSSILAHDGCHFDELISAGVLDSSFCSQISRNGSTSSCLSSDGSQMYRLMCAGSACILAASNITEGGEVLDSLSALPVTPSSEFEWNEGILSQASCEQISPELSSYFGTTFVCP